jgi:hypothetical protein
MKRYALRQGKLRDDPNGDWVRWEDCERLADFIGAKAICPCCCEQEQCVPDCTFAIDYQDGHAAMTEAREVLFGGDGK